jgi:hypothetical protein
MKIKLSKDYSLMKSIYDCDMRNLRNLSICESITCFSDYNGTWEEADVTLKQLKEYAERGYAIKINC